MTAIILWLLLGVGTHHLVRRNYRGWSAARQLGTTRVKQRVARMTGIPLTPSGRRRKLGAAIFKMFGF